jgi:integrase/recombinase XerD
MSYSIADFAKYLQEVKMHRPRTIARYVRVVDDLVDYLGKHKEAQSSTDWASVDRKQLVGFLRARRNNGKQVSAVDWNVKLSAVRSFYNFLIGEGVIAMNTALQIDRQKVHSKERVPLSLDEMLRLVETIEEQAPPAYRTRNAAMIHIMCHCGLRVTEVLSLNLGQVDLENYLFLDVVAKGGKQLAVVFNDVVAEALTKYLADRARLAEGTKDNALFLSDRGKRISVRAVQDVVKTYAKLAGISRSVSPHILRHSAATQLAELGIPIRVIQEICGHASVTTTERYVHASATGKRNAVIALGSSWRRHKEARRRMQAGRSTKADAEE